MTAVETPLTRDIRPGGGLRQTEGCELEAVLAKEEELLEV